MWNTKYFTPFNGSQSPAFLYEVFKDNVRRNWSVEYVIGDSKRVDTDCGRYSSKVWYHKIWHQYYIHSCFRIVNRGKTLKISYAHSGTGKNGIVQENVTIKNSKWTWAKDDNGVYIKDGEADYHPFREEIRSLIKNKNVKPLIAKAIINYRKRQELRFQEEFLNNHSAQIKVTMQDSLNAGNCEAGTLAFIKRHFDFVPDKSDYVSGISADKLLKLNNSYAKRAVLVALKRQFLTSI